MAAILRGGRDARRIMAPERVGCKQEMAEAQEGGVSSTGEVGFATLRGGEQASPGDSRMTTATTPSTPSTTPWPWPEEVLAFAETRGIRAYLEPVLAVTRQLFPRASLEVAVEYDPELKDTSWIVFEVHAPSTDVPDYLQAVRAWNEETLRICPAPLVHNFVLLLRCGAV
jgi:hypothetical protein